MPKTSKDFDCTLNFGVTLEMKQNLIAMGYFMSAKGEYAGVSRNLLKRSFSDWLHDLSDKERQDFNEILANVKIQVDK